MMNMNSDQDDDTFFGRDFARKMREIKQIELEDRNEHLRTGLRTVQAEPMGEDQEMVVQVTRLPHDIGIVEGRAGNLDRRYHAVCTCGYVGLPFYYRRNAENDGDQHVRMGNDDPLRDELDDAEGQGRR